MRCAHCGHPLTTPRMWLGGRITGGWRCTACGQVFYTDPADIESLIRPSFSMLVYSALFPMSVLIVWAFRLSPRIAIFSVVALFVGWMANSIYQFGKRMQSAPTYTSRPAGQRVLLRLAVGALSVFWIGVFTDAQVTGRFESTAPFYGVPTVVCAIIAGVLLFTAWRVRRKHRRLRPHPDGTMTGGELSE